VNEDHAKKPNNKVEQSIPIMFLVSE